MVPIGSVVSDKEVKMLKVKEDDADTTTTDDDGGRQVMEIPHKTLWVR